MKDQHQNYLGIFSLSRQHVCKSNFCNFITIYSSFKICTTKKTTTKTKKKEEPQHTHTHTQNRKVIIYEREREGGGQKEEKK